ncbi:polysaccharide pyruvyl transferase family protein [Sporosarcina sp. BP05]|uniref:polysaccharide pyruvyl transferase family protein n=1 Tax=Sporosarcina sp. BP05 TaxID=2758726 RepID=UPI001644CDDD|nr:polysaccharide pyruvyl transferase family protein [Sporosarcina sp. BP05]
MKKVGIITICDYNNFGNRLQNFAVQEVIKSLGYQVETIVNEHPSKYINDTNKVKSMVNRIKEMSIEEITKKLLSRLIQKSIYRDQIIYYEKRTDAFKKFTHENITVSSIEISNSNIPTGFSNNYDFFVVGSDQIWNPNYRYGSPIDFLRFAPKSKRIAYAPSFGTSKIPNEYIQNYKLWLSEMKNLSVREDAGSKIIKELTGKEALILIDPTLMLSKEKWLTVSKTAINKPKVSYILTYFLGEISHKTKARINRISSENNLEIVNLVCIKDKQHYLTDPSEFIDYINSSEIFLTDSFHGVVFSILLKKPFIVFNKSEQSHSTNSRIETLVSKFNLHQRMSENINEDENIFNIDYTHVDEILEIERKKTIKYLENALNINDNI